MFTGIIEATAKVQTNESGRLILERPKSFDDLKIGSSICVSGTCLSIVEFDETSMQFDVVDETLRKTTLGNLKIADMVNLERSLKADSRFEGHIVQGHVECRAHIIDKQIETGKGILLTISLPEDISSFVIQKGSVAMDGVSLTVAKKDGHTFTVALIPHTLSITTLGALETDDHVNIETDILGRYVLSSRSSL